MGYIYKITNTITNKCYIGETLKNNPLLRWNEHKRKIEKGIGCPALQDAVKKYGIQHFRFDILIICFDEESRYLWLNLGRSSLFLFNILEHVYEFTPIFLDWNAHVILGLWECIIQPILLRIRAVVFVLKIARQVKQHYEGERWCTNQNISSLEIVSIKLTWDGSTPSPKMGNQWPQSSNLFLSYAIFFPSQ